jgi:hypothetical protein
VDRKEELKRWIIERRRLAQLREMDVMPGREMRNLSNN